MTDAKTLSYINLYAILGTLENLCELDSKAKDLLKDLKKPISIGFDVKDGPSATITFSKNGCRMEDGIKSCDIKLPFSSPEKFNGMIDGTVTPIPSKGFTKIGFLTKTFVALTDRLTELMRPTPEALEDREFFELSTTLTFYTIAVALAQIGNQDEIGKHSASYMVDGDLHFGINDGPAATIRVKDHHLVTINEEQGLGKCLIWTFLFCCNIDCPQLFQEGPFSSPPTPPPFLCSSEGSVLINLAKWT